MPIPGSEALKVLHEGTRRMQEGGAGVAAHIPVYAQISHHAARLAGESSVRFFRDPETFLACELQADVLYGMDAPTIHYDVYNIESEALGANLLWGDDQIPSVDARRPLLQSLKEIDKLRPIRMGRAARMPFVLEINRRLADLGFAPKIRFTGLFTFAANLVGLNDLLAAIAVEPEKVHRLMSFLTHEIVAPWIVCQREDSGSNGTATGSDALASPPLLSPAVIREFCLRYVVELERAVGGVRLAGLWGESNVPNPEDLLRIKLEGTPGAIQALDPDVTALGPAYFREFADREEVGLIMGLDANLVGAGPLEAVRRRARRFIEEAGLQGRFILFINDVPYETPPEHVHAVVSVAREYAGNPAAGCYVRTSAGA